MWNRKTRRTRTAAARDFARHLRKDSTAAEKRLWGLLRGRHFAGFLLGTVSGSGVATTVMLGSVSWPLLRRAGYRPEVGGAILSAAGIGALLSPPTLGAAAFLIAEFLGISYLRVLVMATVPTLLYYLSIFLMIEADSRRLGTRPAEADVPGVWAPLLLTVLFLAALGQAAL